MVLELIKHLEGNNKNLHKKTCGSLLSIMIQRGFEKINKLDTSLIK